MAVYGLPHESNATIDSWDEVTAHLDAIVQSRYPVVVEIGDRDDFHPRTHVRFRGLLERRPSHHEDVDLLAVVACHRRGARFEPITMPDDESLTSWLALAPERFESARLSTNDGDDYFFLTLLMGGSTVLLMDSNSH
jgi:hypothetical protein